MSPGLISHAQSLISSVATNILTWGICVSGDLRVSNRGYSFVENYRFCRLLDGVTFDIHMYTAESVAYVIRYSDRVRLAERWMGSSIEKITFSRF